MAPDQTISVKMTDEEIKLIDALISHLKEAGRIHEGTKSEVVRVAVRALANACLTDIERRRFYG